MMAAPSWMLTGYGGWGIHPQALPGWEKRMMVHHLQALILPEGKADTKSWFSTPALPGQLSTTGGWGLYFLDKLGVLACGDFWPWVGWGAVITLAVFLSVLILMIVTSICQPIRSFCTCCCRQTKAVARGVGEFLPELQVGGSYESLDLRVACGKLL